MIGMLCYQTFLGLAVMRKQDMHALMHERAQALYNPIHMCSKIIGLAVVITIKIARSQWLGF